MLARISIQLEGIGKGKTQTISKSKGTEPEQGALVDDVERETSVTVLFFLADVCLQLFIFYLEKL